ncbi:MAG: nucleotide-binding protein [Thermoanaerobaculia bacterium]|jgi:hypothetical protein|nr:nucleotide-binding protein [Thermoanaerobaculia bacterium]
MKALPLRTATAAPILFAALLAAGCSGKEAPQAPATDAGAPLVGAHGGEAAAPAVPSIRGTVLETMDAAGYTYLKLKTAEGETWAAVNEAKVAVGDEVTVLQPMTMDGFESKTLNRTFERIVFGTLGPGTAAPATAPGPAGPVPAAMAAAHAAAADGPETAEMISVAKAEGPEGRTIAELFAVRAALAGKPVAVRGKVVKLNAGIMGKNWLHLRDGSGTAEGKDHDLTVTTQDAVSMGDVVVVKGTVGVDRDFGSGYTYSLLVEDAKVTK